MFEINIYTIKFHEAIEKFTSELGKIRAGRANPNLFKEIRVLSYGEFVPLGHVASIAIPDAFQVLITPYDFSQIKSILESIVKAKLDINPIQDGNKIRIKLQPLTEDKRKQYVKDVKTISENFKKEFRMIRHEGIEQIKKTISSENEQEIYKEQLQKEVDKFTANLQKLTDEKEQELLKI